MGSAVLLFTGVKTKMGVTDVMAMGRSESLSEKYGVDSIQDF